MEDQFDEVVPGTADNAPPTPPLEARIRVALNQCSAEHASDTPDYILAEYLTGCLNAFDQAVRMREKHYGRREFV